MPRRSNLPSVSLGLEKNIPAIPNILGELCEAGQILGSLEMEMHVLADKEEYDEAKDKKTQMDEFRVEVYKTLEITDFS